MRKTAVVTGGASGIGLATAKELLSRGYDVVITDANAERLQKAAKELSSASAEGKLRAIPCDVTKMDSVLKLKEEAVRAFGEIGALVNCAGVFRGGLLHLAAEEDYAIQFAVNVQGAFHTMKAFIPEMIQMGGGTVVNISSASGTRGDYNCPLYCASKAAVANMSRAAALDYAGQGVRIICVAPSATRTPMFLEGSTQEVIDAFTNAIPDHKLGEPEFVAKAICFLLCEESMHIIGHVLPVDGGLTEWNGQPRQDKESN